MAKYKFIKIKDPDNEHDKVSIKFSVETDYLPDLLDAFKEFLLGCGYSIKGDLEVIDDTCDNEDL